MKLYIVLFRFLRMWCTCNYQMEAASSPQNTGKQKAGKHGPGVIHKDWQILTNAPPPCYYPPPHTSYHTSCGAAEPFIAPWQLPSEVRRKLLSAPHLHRDRGEKESLTLHTWHCIYSMWAVSMVDHFLLAHLHQMSDVSEPHHCCTVAGEAPKISILIWNG